MHEQVTDISALPGLKELWDESMGDPRVCIAVLDGPVDQSHPCFNGANLTKLQTLVSDAAGSGHMSGHGTHITSVIFGQQGSPVRGIAPGCRGLIVPVFSDARRGPLSQLDLARAINQAVEAGANVINISGGELAQTAEADHMLTEAVRFCADNKVLIVAAAGNDGCQCLHVPAALPQVLAVGAMNAQRLPFDFSNWGEAYQTQGILAPGENILGAVPGGGIARKSGTSFATPIVSGIVALLLSIQLKHGEKPNPQAVRDAILKSALPCNQQVISDCRRFLVGSLNIRGAYAPIAKGGKKEVSEEKLEEAIIQPSEARNIGQIKEIETIQLSEARNQRLEEFFQIPSVGVQAAAATTSASSLQTMPISENTMNIPSNNVVASSVTPSNVVASGDCGCGGGEIKSLVYALGVLGYDFGNEARRDSFIQLMPQEAGDTPSNPYIASQMVSYLRENPSEAKSLIWTLNIELTPIYAIEPEGPFAHLIYQRLVEFMDGQIQPENSEEFISRVSIPGVLTGRSVRLFSGQIVPIVVPQLRGMYGWKVNSLVRETLRATRVTSERADNMRSSLTEFLNRLYYEFRNLGQTSRDRALNYTATNAFQAAQVWSEASSAGMQLDTIEVEKSPFCRMDSDCWDVKLRFFDPENDRKARKIYRFTIDVSDVMPVTVGTVRSWSAAG
jgi:cyanobactin maturation PatA/PatG family protease